MESYQIECVEILGNVSYDHSEKRHQTLREYVCWKLPKNSLSKQKISIFVHDLSHNVV